jgi:hypothetical protein
MQSECNSTEPPALRRRSKTQRSAVSNGTKLLMADGRSPWSRRFRDIVVATCNDLGGYENLSAAEIAIVRRAATIQVELEAQEARLANGEAKGFSLIEYAQAANGMRRLLETVGIKRVPRDVSPSLADILRDAANKPAHAPEPRAAVTIEAEPAEALHGVPKTNTGAVE